MSENTNGSNPYLAGLLSVAGVALLIAVILFFTIPAIAPTWLVFAGFAFTVALLLGGIGWYRR